VLLGGAMDPRPRLAFTVGAVLVNVGVAVGLDRCMRLPLRLSTKILSTPVLVGIGRVSYSLYLWQQIFINRESTAWANAFPRNALLAGLTAVVSFFLVEQPSLSARVALQAWLARVFPARPVATAGPRLSPPTQPAA
jgi:peptidoglycan/LPS O-acetylase OafA/YrhL